MSDVYQVVTPENVEIDYEIAGIGSRFLALTIDLIIQTIIAGAIIMALALFGFEKEQLTEMKPDLIPALVIGLLFILGFIISFGYFIILEMVMNGQTIGKKIVNIRVRKDQGNAPTFWDVLLRNLIRLVDFLPLLYGVGFVTMFLNKKSKRLGDFAAGTIVVKELPRKKVKQFFTDSVNSTVMETSGGPFLPIYPWMSLIFPFMTQDDYLMIKNLHSRRKELNNLSELTTGVIHKICKQAGLEEAPVVKSSETVAVLQEMIAGYEKTYFI